MLRGLLLEHSIESIEPVSNRAFEGRVVETAVLTVRKGPPRRGRRVSLPAGKVPQGELALGPGLRFCTSLSADERRMVSVMERQSVELSTLFEVRDGISTGFQPFPKRLLGRVLGDCFEAEDGTRVRFDPARHRRVIDGGEFAAFAPIRWEGRWIEYDKRHEHDPPHPGRPFNCQLRERCIYERPEKLLTRQTARGLIATLDRVGYFVRNSVHVTFPKSEPLFETYAGTGDSRGSSGNGPSLAALCACLNSDLYERYFLAVTGEDGHLYPQVHIADLKRLPILPELLESGEALHELGEDLLALHAADADGNATRIRKERSRVEDILREAFGVDA
jgi:hypothetical protein